MRHLLLSGLLVVDLLLLAESFILPPGYVTPLFPNLPVPVLPTLGVIQASGLMPLLVSTLNAVQVRVVKVQVNICYLFYVIVLCIMFYR